MKIITVLGIDLAKNIYHLHGVDGHGKAGLKKRMNHDGKTGRSSEFFFRSDTAHMWVIVRP